MISLLECEYLEEDLLRNAEIAPFLIRPLTPRVNSPYWINCTNERLTLAAAMSIYFWLLTLERPHSYDGRGKLDACFIEKKD